MKNFAQIEINNLISDLRAIAKRIEKIEPFVPHETPPNVPDRSDLKSARTHLYNAIRLLNCTQYQHFLDNFPEEKELSEMVNTN